MFRSRTNRVGKQVQRDSASDLACPILSLDVLPLVALVLMIESRYSQLSSGWE